MTNQYTSRDLEMLSTYIDGQLTGSELARLESRLQVETELRSTLEDMRRTRAILRAAPTMRAPRNYTLKPGMVKIPRRTPPAYPFLRLASALASLLFILAFAGDLISRGAPAQAPVALVQEGVDLNAAQVEEAAVTEQVLMQSKAPPAPAQESLSAQMATGTAEAPMLQMEMMAASPAATQNAAEQSPETGDTMREAPGTQSGQPVIQTEAEDQAETKTAKSPGGFNPLRVLEVIALILAIATGLGAFYVRRMGSNS